MDFLDYGFSNSSIAANEHELGEKNPVKDSGHLIPIITQPGLCVTHIRGMNGLGQEKGR